MKTAPSTVTHLVGLIWLVLLCALQPGLAHAGEQSSSVLVKSVAVAREDISKTVKAYGKVGFDNAWLSNINSAHAGQIVHLSVMPGQPVRKGDVLAQIRTSASGLKAYRQAINARNYAKKNLKRLKELYDQHFATQAQITAAKKNLADAENQVTQMEDQGVNNALDIIRSPFSGIVSSVAVKRGQRVSAGSTLLILGRSDRLKVIVGSEPEESKHIRQGMPVHLESVFDKTVTAESDIASMHRVIDPKTRLVDAVVLLQNEQTRNFTPGMQVEAIITLNTVSGALTVPNSAVLHDSQGDYLFIIRKHKARRINIETVLSENGKTAVHGPLHAGEHVVILGNYELSDGMKVREHTP
ncbi:MAG TPA: efflux RND transporter periplasmic adaptor subunit [Mariprofundaceae bacterium]|nr:efflux RND transporter periplasmic adaptor subunit [Mariprofundaceae bacterium]